MRARVSSLLCELHAHTTWSDGELSLPELVDLYGSAGFDVLCVTDHVLRGDDPWPAAHGRPCVDEDSFAPYLEAIARERDRARSAYGLVVVPGLELTYNDPDPDRKGRSTAIPSPPVCRHRDDRCAGIRSAGVRCHLRPDQHPGSVERHNPVEFRRHPVRTGTVPVVRSRAADLDRGRSPASVLRAGVPATRLREPQCVGTRCDPDRRRRAHPAGA